MTILLVISLLGNILLIYSLVNLLKKQEKIETSVLSLEQYIEGMLQTIEYIDNRLKQVDEHGAFKSDDEI